MVEDEYVKTKPVPAWMARFVWAVAPTVVIVVVGNSLLSWRNDAVFARDLSELTFELREFKRPGGRCSAGRCDEMDRRLHSMETWRQRHTEWGRERVGRWEATFADIQRRLDSLERRNNLIDTEWKHKRKENDE